MEKVRLIGDVEEGEISDSGSVEEISEEDFKRQDSMESKGKGSGTESRVWTIGDLCKYPPFLYNIAWAQAVQNKSLSDILVVDVDDSDGEKPPSKLDDDEKEEGELEEGEIDLDSDHQISDSVRLRETLGSVNVADAEKSFEEACSRIENTLESLRALVSDPQNDSFDDVLFAAVEVVNSVFCSMNLDWKEQNKESLSRLLSSIMNCDPPILSPAKLKEIELMTASLSPVASDKANDKKRDTQAGNIDPDPTTSNSNSTEHEQTSVKWPSLASVLHSKPVTLPEVLRPGVPAFKGRGLLVPLLDLHKVYDENSLPSPTRDTPLHTPFQKPLGFLDGLVKHGPTVAKVATGDGDPRLLHYETDAFKAVSTYQQKFGQSSFLMSDNLPSPTPSEEESNAEDNDTNMEISSSLPVGNLRTLGQTISRPLIVPSFIPANSPITQAPTPAINVTPSSSGLNPTVKASARSRDPRLRFANSDLSALDHNPKPLTTAQNAPKTEIGEPINSRKQKASDEINLDDPASKRQRNAYENAGISSSDMKSLSGVVGRMEDNGTVGSQLTNQNQLETAEADPRRSVLTVNYQTVNGPHIGKEQVPLTSTPNSLPELLKDIACNPEILLNILKGQQQRLAAVSQPQSNPAKDTILHPGANLAPLVSIIPPSKAPPANPSSITSQVGLMRTQGDTGKIRMKPRDPRRVLHGNTLQKTGALVDEQLKTVINKKDTLNGQKIPEGPADMKLMPAQSVAIPDITRQFTKNLKNIADIMSVSAPTSTAIVSQDLLSQPAQVRSDRGDVQAVGSKIEDQQSGTTTTTLEPTVSGPSRTPNTWGDVEHLFEGYDDQQKLAIQRERERRLGEQKKMFEARKLCLVLDLDHTLLNSAKFVEVDLVHDEILRKKEEQDREKPQRHLYRLPHMGMWTKLRPGIWNFLDKASKLFEMHLYTMGNKLYATEMAKVLDPKGTLFSGRVISRGDDGEPYDGDERVPKSKDLEGVLGMESAVVIIDDSVRVWPHNKLNLIVVERYTYFPCSRRQFGLPGPSLLEIDHDERPEDGTLASSLGVIERIHENFFSHQSLDEADVRNILSSEQQKILAGCRIVFSRVFPVSEVNPHLHPLWQTAQQFGAVCTTQIDDQVTHVVANSAGTDKVNWALANGRFAVHPGWVEASALLYRRANEQDFAIKPTPPT